MSDDVKTESFINTINKIFLIGGLSFRFISADFGNNNKIGWVFTKDCVSKNNFLFVRYYIRNGTWKNNTTVECKTYDDVDIFVKKLIHYNDFDDIFIKLNTIIIKNV